jgi:hypothetical protein
MHAADSAALWTCSKSVKIVEAEATAKALAKAVAEAISLAYADCSTADGGFVCGVADASISVWIDAVVRAWAGAWAKAVACGTTCKITADVVVDAIAHLYVDASTDALAVVCGGMPPLSL